MSTTKTGRELGEEAGKAAAAHADLFGDFTELALQAFRAYAWAHAEFTTEDVRRAFRDVVPRAPDNRAWGHIARLAVREGICKRVGMTRAAAPHCHGTWISVYQSLCLYA